MKLEHQVVSLELAKRLKELGVKQEGLFAWTEQKEKLFTIGGWDANGNAADRYIVKQYAAFTVAELGEILPYGVQQIKDSAHHWYMNYQWYRDEVHDNHDLREQTQADALANMLIYLLENRLITL